ncbi:MAG: hypothetical protein NVS9B7_20350 [Flavisolibacter sp.]
MEQTLNSISLKDFSNAGKLVVVFGNEVTGVEQSTIGLCHGSIEIPQFGMKHSLNVSVATGIVLWDIARLRL